MNAPLRPSIGRPCSRPGCWQRDTLPATVDGRPGFLCSRCRSGDSGGPLFTAPAVHELPPPDDADGLYGAWPTMDRILLVVSDGGALRNLELSQASISAGAGAARREGFLRAWTLTPRGRERVARLRENGPPGPCVPEIKPDGAGNRTLLLIADGMRRLEVGRTMGWTQARVGSIVGNLRRYGHLDALDRVTAVGWERVARLRAGGGS